MKKRLEEIERNMGSILREINEILDTSDNEYRNIEVSFWLTSFKINLWNGRDHAPISQAGFYNGTLEELIDWVKKRKILFQKFDGVLKEEKE